MKINRRLTIAIVLIALVFWLYHWCQPERQVRRAQARLLSAAESGDFDSFAQLIANDYRDGWGHDKTFVVKAAQQVFPDFKLLDIERADRGLEPGADGWVLREKITFKGIGGPLAMVVRERVNRLREPVTTKWRKSGWWPWNWELTGMEQPEIAASEMEYEF